MRGAIRNLFNRFIAALFFLQGTGWLFGFGKTVQEFAQAHPILTGILFVVYLTYCHIVWDWSANARRLSLRPGDAENESGTAANDLGE